MSKSVLDLLKLFDALPDPEKQSAAVEILRRVSLSEEDIPTSTLDDLADQLFATLDAEENARAER